MARLSLTDQDQDDDEMIVMVMMVMVMVMMMIAGQKSGQGQKLRVKHRARAKPQSNIFADLGCHRKSFQIPEQIVSDIPCCVENVGKCLGFHHKKEHHSNNIYFVYKNRKNIIGVDKY